jgi:2-polyprenyl-3-methyl-5-hydroxy-6-metoxy-1,4-benzoquinol methylase
MANLIGGVRYFGVDFSPSAIAYARRACKNPHAYFKCGDLYAIEPMIVHDTVLMLELLEHVKEHKPLVDYALAHAGKRVIVTVPRDMPGRAHLHPKWDKPKLQALLGGDIDAHLFGGDKADRWWIAIKEMR